MGSLRAKTKASGATPRTSLVLADRTLNPVHPSTPPRRRLHRHSVGMAVHRRIPWWRWPPRQQPDYCLALRLGRCHSPLPRLLPPPLGPPPPLPSLHPDHL